jgi:hypothetical protein
VLQQTPLAEIFSPPLLTIVPPLTAVVAVGSVTSFVVISGTVAQDFLSFLQAIVNNTKEAIKSNTVCLIIRIYFDLSD